MFKLIEAFLGVMLFLFLGSLLILKNQDNVYSFQASEHYNLPSAFLEEEIEEDMQSFSLQDYFPWEMNINNIQTSTEGYIKSISIKDEYYGNHQVQLKLDTLQRSLNLNIKGRKNILLRLFWLFNMTEINKTKNSLPSILKNKIAQSEKKFNTYRTQWNGEGVSDAMYYLAIEKIWDSLPKQTLLANAQKELKEFALEQQIPIQGKIFTVYPYSIGRKILRFALPVDRYYSTKSQSIKCRKFKGGNFISLTHFGLQNNLEKSWEKLKDSLAQGGYTLSYPPIERYPVNNSNELNPYKWETKLMLTITK